MKLITEKGNGFLFSETHGHAVYYENPGNNPGKILKVVKNARQEAEWAKTNWGCEPQEPTEAEMLLLERMAPFRRHIKTLAIKNAKASSLELKQSGFFKVPGGLLSRANGITRRKTHQGENSWYLFNFEPVLGVIPNSLYCTGSSIDFGTYNGKPNPWFGLMSNEIEPIIREDWERLSGRKFRLAYEFTWFKSQIEPYQVIGGYDQLDFPANTFRGLYLFDLSKENKENWVEELQPAMGRAYICYAHGNGDHTVPNIMLKEIFDGGNLGEEIFVAN